MKDFVGLSAIVTGGSSGIGHATVKALHERGAKVCVLDLQGPLSAVDGVTYLTCDIQSRTAVTASINEAAAKMDGIDVVINNAGIGSTGSVADGDDAEWHRVLDINVVGTARVSSASLPFLRKSEHASIVNVSSLVAMVGLPQRAIYSASKGAIYSLTLAMASDHVREGIRVNCVLPGTADTPWVGRLLANSADPAATEKALKARQPMGRLVSADEVAFAICYLASPLASSTTGTALGVDGGSVGLRVPQA
ncbi:MAG: SDR family NAD(P)-dependent oxidoreductase [Actinobacteria bacterium]|nr:SDR family NAD(P)-dependent oxidoreductase [Actinomycetota bacterium]